MNYKAILLILCLLLSISCSGEKREKSQSQGVVPEISPGVNSKTGIDAKSFEMEMIYATDEDRKIYNDYIAYIKPFKSLELSELIIKTAYFFLDKPYVASTLEFEPEGLVVNMRELDCTTFVETVLALSRAVKLRSNPTFEEFCGQLRNIRYRRGTVGDYTSRIHYFSDWIYENETREHVRDVTKQIGGKPYKIKVNYMSIHPNSYKQLKSSLELIKTIQKQELDISGRTVYSNIPVSDIGVCGKKMKDGDIVCFVTDIEGLDISHVGFIHLYKGQITFIHASSTAKKVIVNPQDLSTYMGKNKRNIGVMIARPFLSK